MPGFDAVAHGLADAVIGENEHLQIVTRQQVELSLAVFVFAQGSLHLEVIAPAAEFEALIAPVVELLRQFFQRQMRPLAAKEQDRTAHVWLLRDVPPSLTLRACMEELIRARSVSEEPSARC